MCEDKAAKYIIIHPILFKG